MASRNNKPLSVKSLLKNNIRVEIIQIDMNMYSIVIDTQTEKHRHNQVFGESGRPSIGLYAATENKKQKQNKKKKAKTSVQEKELTTPVTWVFASTDNKKECKQEHNDKRIFIRTTRIVGGDGKSLSLRSWTFVRKDIENENSVAENDALLQNYGRNGIGLPKIKIKTRQIKETEGKKQKSNTHTNVLLTKHIVAASIDVGSVESRHRVTAKVKHKKENKEMCTGDYGSKQIHDENQRRKRNNKGNNKERYLRIDKVQIKAITPKPQNQKKRKLKVSKPESSYKVICQNLWQRRKTTKMIAAKREEGKIYHEVPKRRKFLLPGDRGTRGAYRKIKKFERARQNCEKGPFLHKKLSRRNMNELALQRYEGKLKKHEKYINMNYEEAPKHEKNMNMKNKEAPKHEKYMNMKNEEAPKHEKNMHMKNKLAPKNEKYMNMKNEEAPKHEKHMDMINEEAPKHEKNMNMKNKEAPKHEKYINMKNKEAPKHEKYMSMKNEEAPKHEKHMNMKNEEAPKHERYMNMNNEEAPKPEKNMNKKNKEAPKHEKYMNMNNEEALKHEKNMNMKNKEAPKREKYMNMKNEEAPKHEKHMNMKNEEVPKHEKHINTKNEEAPSHVICKDPLSSTVLVNSDVTIKLMKGLGLLVDLEPEAIQTEVSLGEVFEDVVLESSNCNDDLDYRHV